MLSQQIKVNFSLWGFVFGCCFFLFFVCFWSVAFIWDNSLGQLKKVQICYEIDQNCLFLFFDYFQINTSILFLIAFLLLKEKYN